MPFPFVWVARPFAEASRRLSCLVNHNMSLTAAKPANRYSAFPASRRDMEPRGRKDSRYDCGHALVGLGRTGETYIQPLPEG